MLTGKRPLGSASPNSTSASAWAPIVPGCQPMTKASDARAARVSAGLVVLAGLWGWMRWRTRSLRRREVELRAGVGRVELDRALVEGYGLGDAVAVVQQPGELGAGDVRSVPRVVLGRNGVPRVLLGHRRPACRRF